MEEVVMATVNGAGDLNELSNDIFSTLAPHLRQARGRSDTRRKRILAAIAMAGEMRRLLDGDEPIDGLGKVVGSIINGRLILVDQDGGKTFAIVD